MADAIRVLAMDAVEAANSGHPGMPMGMADVATVLWSRFLKFDAAAPDWPDRDRFVLSNGHGSMLQYALLHLTGFEGVGLEDLKRFRQLGSRTPGHPEYGHTAGVETTTGPLGQGLATAVGMAMAERALAARFGGELVDHRTWVLAGDGDLMEGVSHESIHLAGRLGLHKLTVLWDDNLITIDGAASLSETGDQLRRFEAAGWAVRAVDGHDMAAVEGALAWAVQQDRPALIACRTKIGRGSPSMEGHQDTHGKALGPEAVAEVRDHLGWPHDPFVVPDAVYAAWRPVGRRGASVRAGWEARLAKSSRRPEFEHALSGELPQPARTALADFAQCAAEARPTAATRVHSGKVLDALVPVVPEMIGGSADLTGSVNTLVKGMGVFDAPDYAGRYVYYGVREHAMAAAMNGMALHGGVVPYAGTFLVFSDYSRPAIRLGALMGVRVVHVMTHDSIGLGEDGPTHQPVEHLASLRAIPNLQVFRPADGVETAECWALALSTPGTPSVLALSRQSAPAVRTEAGENRSARGAYQLFPADGPARVTLFATGTEVGVAAAAREQLQAEGVPTRVVSVPCMELFAAQDAAYRREVLGQAPVRVAVEAGLRLGWDALIGPEGRFIGMTGFGASAPAPALYKHFGITPEAVVEAVKAAL
ncbi:MAG: transketolase [Proteobacteria bacterium]|nr:transketolase [Pseudomonadota bacterium]